MQENPNLESQDNNNEDNNQYIETIKELKENTVSKEKYKKLEEENRKLLENVFECAKHEQCQMILIAGDLFDSRYVTPETEKFVKEIFRYFIKVTLNFV